MNKGKLGLTVGEIQGHLRCLLKSEDLSTEQRYSIVAAVESMDFIRLLSPGLKKAMKERKNGKFNGTSAVVAGRTTK